jgi:tRNA U34 5-carboxymethylaminomethyl modifying enzyme MnmG/GidA
MKLKQVFIFISYLKQNKYQSKRRKKSNEDKIKTNFDFHKLFEIKQISTKQLRFK